MRTKHDLTKEQWIARYGGQELLDREGFDVIPCVECDDRICHGWRVVSKVPNRDVVTTRKLRVTYISHRGMGSHLNLYPEVHYHEYTPSSDLWTFDDEARALVIKGMVILRGAPGSWLVDRFIPGSAIIECVPAEQTRDL